MGLVRLFVAELEGRTISAALNFPFGDTVRGWKIGWAGDHSECCPNDLLYWESIHWAKVNGYRCFDFVSIEKDLAQKMQQGDPVDWKSVEGPSKFKVGFGGTPVVLPKPYYRFYDPILRTLGQAGGSKLIESRTGERLLGRFLKRLAAGSDG
jgi:hypothetical protein